MMIITYVFLLHSCIMYVGDRSTNFNPLMSLGSKEETNDEYGFREELSSNGNQQ